MDEAAAERVWGVKDNAGRWYPGYVVAILTVAMAFSLIDRFTLSLLFEPIKADLGLGDTELGLLHGVAFGLFYAFFGIPLARLVDLWSRRGVILWGIAVWSLATAACGLARTYPALMAARIGVGVGEAGLAPAGYSLLSDLIPPSWRGTAISIFQSGSLFGAGAALLGGGLVYEAMIAVGPQTFPLIGALAPWQLTFIALALPGLPILALIALVREPARGGQPAGLVPASNENDAGGLWGYLKANAALSVSLFLVGGGLVAVSYTVLSWGPSLLIRTYGWLPLETGVWLGILTLAAAPLGVIVGGLLVDRIRGNDAVPHSRVLALAALLTAPATLAIAISNEALIVFGLFAVTQFTTGLAIGVGPAATQQIADTNLRGRLSAVYVFAVNLLGLGIGPVAVGILSDNVFAGRFALQNAMATFMFAMAVLALAAAYIFRTAASRRAAAATNPTA